MIPWVPNASKNFWAILRSIDVSHWEREWVTLPQEVILWQIGPRAQGPIPIPVYSWLVRGKLAKRLILYLMESVIPAGTGEDCFR